VRWPRRAGGRWRCNPVILLRAPRTWHAVGPQALPVARPGVAPAGHDDDGGGNAGHGNLLFGLEPHCRQPFLKHKLLFFCLFIDPAQ
jgi:hypothetical protein